LIRLQCEDDLVAVSTEALRLAFSWVVDRWTHVLVIGQGDRRRAFADAEELDDRSPDLRVLSPVFQDLQPVETEDGVSLLLVGRHGPVFFSASFQVRESFEGGAHESRVDVDLAARCRGPIDSLESRYQVYRRGCSLHSVAADSAQWCAEPGEPDVSIQVDGGLPSERGSSNARLALEERTDPDLGYAYWLLTISPEVPSDVFTHRWAYSWRSIKPEGPASAR
jgi:hypothetical protein